MKNVIVALAVVLVGGLVAAAPLSAKGPFKVGVGKPGPVRVGAATAVSSSMQFDWLTFTVNKDGSAMWTLDYSSSVGQHAMRTLRVDSGCTQVTDQFGTIVYTTTGGSDPLCTTLSGAITRTTALLSACASGGKCNF